MNLEVTLTPAEFETLQQRGLANAACVVFDVLRATSTIVTALARGAEAVLPVASIAEARELRGADSRVLLAGERHGLRITAAQSGGVDFDLGNSPREYTAARVHARRIITTTTNGTRAFAACRGARHLFAGSFLNLTATAQHLRRLDCACLILVCAGTGEQLAFEDCLGAGALCHRLRDAGAKLTLDDSAHLAAEAFSAHGEDLESAMRLSSNARRLRAIPELCEDVPLCLTEDLFPVVVAAGADGWLRRLSVEQL